MYQYVSPNLDNLQAHDLSRQLELIARRVVGDVNRDGSVTHFDALQEPAENGLSRPGHPLGDATRRASYKDGQTTSVLEAVNSCLDEWMNADTWIESNPDWIALEDWLDTLSTAGAAPPVAVQIAAIPADLTGGNADKGLQTFNESCAICHRRNGTGSVQAPAIGALGLDPSYVANRVRTSGRGNSNTYDGLTGGIMPFWGANRLSDEDLLDLVAMLELGEVELAVVSGKIKTGTSNGECASDHPRVGQTAELITRFHNVTGTATLVDNCTIEITNFNYVTFRLSLPADMSLDDFDSISIWCVAVGISFGDAIFQF